MFKPSISKKKSRIIQKRTFSIKRQWGTKKPQLN